MGRTLSTVSRRPWKKRLKKIFIAETIREMFVEHSDQPGAVVYRIVFIIIFKIGYSVLKL